MKFEIVCSNSRSEILIHGHTFAVLRGCTKLKFRNQTPERGSIFWKTFPIIDVIMMMIVTKKVSERSGYYQFQWTLDSKRFLLSQ